MIKKLSLVCIAIGLVVIGPLANADALKDIQASNVIRVAMDLGNPPFGYKNKKLKNVGYDVYTAKLLAKDLGVKLKLVPTTQSNRIPYLLTGKADIVISSLAATPARKKVIDFSNAYGAVLNVVAAPKSMRISGPADLTGHRIAVTRGTTNDRALTKIAPSGTDIVRFGDESTTITAITSGRVKLIADNPFVVKTVDNENPSLDLVPKFTLKEIKLGIGVRKGENNLKQWLNNWIQDNLQNGKLNQGFKKYFGVNLPKEITTEDDTSKH